MINPAEGGDFHLAKTGDFGVAVDNKSTQRQDISKAMKLAARIREEQSWQ